MAEKIRTFGKKKLVPEFSIRELFGKNLPEGVKHGL